jgi:hypothetical protein
MNRRWKCAACVERAKERAGIKKAETLDLSMKRGEKN